MSTSPVGNAVPANIAALISKSAPTPVAIAPTDGDSPAVEAMESHSSKVAEKSNGGFAPKSSNVVNKVV